jgi:hypothetical protein
MPDTTLAAAIQEAYAASPVDAIIHHTLEIRHAAFSSPIRVVRDFANLTATLEATAPENPGEAVLFLGFSFDLVPPEVSAASSPQLVIEIDNVSRDILANIELAMSSTDLIEVSYRAYLSTDLTGPQNDPPLTLTIFEINATPMRIRAVAGFRDISNKRFPAGEYSTEQFPGLTPQ